MLLFLFYFIIDYLIYPFIFFLDNNLVFAEHAFQIQDGRETVDTLVEKKLIQNVY